MGNSVDGRQEGRIGDESVPNGTRNTLKGPLSPEEVFDRRPDDTHPPQKPRSGALSYEHGIVDVPAEALRPTLLWRLFRSGARAVRVLNDPIIPQLWRDLMPPSDAQRETALGEILPWASSLQSVTQNFHPAPCVGQMVGDLFYVRPPVLTYVARKMLVYPRDGGSDLVLEPGVMYQDGGTFRLPGTLVRSVWELGTRLLESLSAPNWKLERPAVALERLKYAASLDELRRRIQLVRNSVGPWAQYGHQFDERVSSTARPFQRKFLREMFALGRMLPRVGPMLERINQYALQRSPQDLLPAGAEMAGEPHTDNRLFSCLTSRRVGVRTEFLGEDGAWRELPVNADSLVIFPGNLARQALGLEPTYHRILYTGDGEPGAMNATMMVGLSPRIG